jgi:hypothetical protein
VSDVECMRWNDWKQYLSERGLTRGSLGHRILTARGAGYTRSEIADMMGVSPGYVSRLASTAKAARHD